MSDESLAEKISGEPPWWAQAPVWLAAGIVGVPSFIAISAGWYIAQHVSTTLRELTQISQTQLNVLNEHNRFAQRSYDIVLKFIDDDLRCQYVTCLNSAKTPMEQKACISPSAREQEYGMEPRK